MIGILFFLFEFYDDQLLAFMVLILVWLCELFTLIRYPAILITWCIISLAGYTFMHVIRIYCYSVIS